MRAKHGARDVTAITSNADDPEGAAHNFGVMHERGWSLSQGIVEIDSDIGALAGGILAAWFMANPAGPTAWTLGYVERGGRHELFYRWMHFTGGRTWIIGDLESDSHMLNGDFGEIVFNSVIRFHNFCLSADVNEEPILGVFPSFIRINGNRHISEALRALILLALAKADWTREFYLNARYGADFYARAGAEIRSALESARYDPLADQQRVDHLFEWYAGRPGFSDEIPKVLEPITPNVESAKAWWDHSAGVDVTNQGLSFFAEMWAGATSQISPDFLSGLKRNGRYTSFSRVVTFFDQFQMPLWPNDLDDRKICELLGIPTHHLD